MGPSGAPSLSCPAVKITVGPEVRVKYRNPHDNSPGAKRNSPLGPGPAVMARWLGTGRAPSGAPGANTAVHRRGHGAGKRKACVGAYAGGRAPDTGKRTGCNGRCAMRVAPETLGPSLAFGSMLDSVCTCPCQLIVFV